MVDKVKMVEKHLKIVSQINIKMRSLQLNIEDLDKLRSIEKNVPSSLPGIKSYDISLHTLATSECQELASRFVDNFRQNLVGMMDLYEKTIYNIQRNIQWPEFNFKDEHLVPFSFF